jgi:hypothetical protein
MATERTDGAEAFERSRAHRRGLRQAGVELEEALARPAAQDPKKWSADVATGCHQLAGAFRHHVEVSEGPAGLLSEIMGNAPRLAHAVGRVKKEHEVLLDKMKRLEHELAGEDYSGQVDTVRGDVLHLLQELAAHRNKGADLIYEAYSVDVEGGDSA